MKTALPVVVLSALALRPLRVYGDVKLPALFSDHMVLQAGAEVPVWGWAGPGERVTVAFRDQTVATTAGADGTWKLTLQPLSPGRPDVMTVTGRNTLRLANVAVGEVWLCAGQSNMVFRMESVLNARQEAAAADLPMIRCFTARGARSAEPQKDVSGRWSVATPRSVPAFSAVGWFFARRIHEELKVPVGIIVAARGGTSIETWMSLTALRSQPRFQPILELWGRTLGTFRKQKEAYLAALAVWERASRGAQQQDEPIPAKPKPPAFPSRFLLAGNYNALIAPLAPYRIRGVLWYQGAAAALRANVPKPVYRDNTGLYRDLQATLIADWRGLWGQGDFPFLVVQLPNFQHRMASPSRSTYAIVREAQLKTLSVPNAGMVVTLDVGKADDLHPPNKKPIGQRLALWALGTTYGRDLVYSGPLFKSASVEPGRIRLAFDHVGGGLAARGGGPLKGFTIAGEGRQFVPADAVIERNTVVVSSPKVPAPVAVRYAWADNPDANLQNKQGLPASPFRTDDW